jgi:hypothetical protein
MELSLPLDMLLVVVVVLHKRVLMEDQLAVLEVMEFLINYRYNNSLCWWWRRRIR